MRKEISWHIVGAVARRIVHAALIAGTVAMVDVALLDEAVGDAVRRLVDALLGS